MKKALLSLILLVINVLTLAAQHKIQERIETNNGSIFVGEVVMETENLVKVVIGRQTVVNIEKTDIVSRTLENNKKKNHIISSEFSNYYIFALGLSYDYNAFRKENLLIGGTVSAGIVGFRAGGYAAYRLVWQDLLKAEVGYGTTVVPRFNITFLTGPYLELGYRFQRDDRWFFWEVNVGSIYDFSPYPAYHAYGGVGIGISF